MRRSSIGYSAKALAAALLGLSVCAQLAAQENPYGTSPEGHAYCGPSDREAGTWDDLRNYGDGSISGGCIVPDDAAATGSGSGDSSAPYGTSPEGYAYCGPSDREAGTWDDLRNYGDGSISGGCIVPDDAAATGSGSGDPAAPYGTSPEGYAYCGPSDREAGSWDDLRNYGDGSVSGGCIVPDDSAVADLGGTFLPARNPKATSGGVFNQQEGRNSTDLDVVALTVSEDPPGTAYDSGGRTIPNEANFRVSCQYSHFARDDSIVKPGLSGQSHLHMFFGNTVADANTDVGGDNIEDSGGGSCNGYALNRSAYWVPALLDGDGNALVPYSIIVYYKTKMVDVRGGIQPMPQGLKMVAGNPIGSSFALNDPNRQSEEDVFWQCGESGSDSDFRTTIPTDCGDREINATVRFPQCVRPGQLTSDDPKRPTHTYRLDDGRNQDCPAGFVRMPELSVLLYWKPPANPAEVADWRLSSDAPGTATPGGTLHADWIGGWNDSVMQEFLDNCLSDVSTSSEPPTGLNCGFGNLGSGRALVGSNLRLDEELQRVRRSDLP